MRGAALDDAFWDQLSGRSFGKPLWELAFGNNYLCHLIGFLIGLDLYYQLSTMHIIFFWGMCICRQNWDYFVLNLLIVLNIRIMFFNNRLYDYFIIWN